MEKEQRKRLDGLVSGLQKQFGKEAISLFGKNQAVVERVPVSSFQLAELMGGGYPRGRMIEIFGPESSGKTTLACYLAAECQKNTFVVQIPSDDGKKTEKVTRKGVVAYIDAEHAIDPVYAQTFGLKIEDCLFSQPNSAEEALNLVDALVSSKEVDLIVVDSVAALVPRAEADGDMGDAHMGLQARLMSQACRKLSANMRSEDATIIWVNQVRSKIGIVYGNPEVTPGGNALKFYTSIRMTVRRKENIEEKSQIVGMLSHVKTLKNKVAAPFKECDMKIIFGKGYQVEEEYVEAFAKYRLIDKGGAGWYTLLIEDGTGNKETVKRQGDESVSAWLKEHPTVYEGLKEKLQTIIRSQATSVVIETEEDEDKAVAEQRRIEEEEFSTTEKALGSFEGIERSENVTVSPEASQASE